MTLEREAVEIADAYGRRHSMLARELARYRDRKRTMLMLPNGGIILAAEFIARMVEHHANGKKKFARSFYNGAFEFAEKPEIRLQLLQSSVARAAFYFQKGEHQLVWRLIDLAHSFPPEGMSSRDLLGVFAQAGVVVSALIPPDENEKLWRSAAAEPALSHLVS